MALGVKKHIKRDLREGSGFRQKNRGKKGHMSVERRLLAKKARRYVGEGGGKLKGMNQASDAKIQSGNVFRYRGGRTFSKRHSQKTTKVLDDLTEKGEHKDVGDGLARLRGRLNGGGEQKNQRIAGKTQLEQ